MLRLWLALRGVGESRLPEVQQIVDEFALAEAGEQQLPRADLQAMLSRGEILLLDVRPALEYEHGHLSGAQSLPIDELPRRLDELPRDRRIVAYCRGAYCLFADEAVAILRRHGFDALRLDGGWVEWTADQSMVGAALASPDRGGGVSAPPHRPQR